VTACAPDAVAARVEQVRQRVERAGRNPDDIRIVAVTKGFGPEAVRAALSAGLADVGENYAQELLAKAGGSPAQARWHFLGPVQRNKVSRLARVVRAWHAVDREAAAEAVAEASPGVEILVQVNVTGQAARPGCRPEAVDALVERCRDLPCELSGLMAIGPAGDAEGSRECFRWLAKTAGRLGLAELSMGMSDDFEIAVTEGATTLRLGRVIFGPRPGRKAVQG
jgi:pyridoxal phosphate enzyme (YggS family)